jgi:hypothetical protein
MYRYSPAVPSPELEGVFFETFGEGEDSSERYYYWEAWHRPANEWILKEQTKYDSLGRIAASNRQVQFADGWFRKLGLSGGWLFIARYYWNGSSWQRDRCDMRDLVSGKIYPC